jgi:hypothetical protein
LQSQMKSPAAGRAKEGYKSKKVWAGYNRSNWLARSSAVQSGFL